MTEYNRSLVFTLIANSVEEENKKQANTDIVLKLYIIYL